MAKELIQNCYTCDSIISGVSSFFVNVKCSDGGTQIVSKRELNLQCIDVDLFESYAICSLDRLFRRLVEV